jgi:iron-sulfur cluster repair protein YtfE (RIC family)
MASATQLLRDEHKTLVPHIENIRAVADLVGDTSPPAVQQGVDDVYQFLTRRLIPHAEAEDRALYPTVQKVMGAPLATATMSRDHVEVGRLTKELRTIWSGLGTPIDSSQEKDLRRLLYGLYALIKVHFAKEEEIYLPLLAEGLTEAQVHHVFRAMGHAEEHAGEQHGN